MPWPYHDAGPFADLSATTVAALQRLAVPQRWLAREVVMHVGNSVTAVKLIVSGRVRLTAVAPDGHEVLFRWFGPGEFIGLAALLDDQPFAMDAIAAEPGEALHYEADQFMDLLRADPGAMLAMARIVARHAHALTELVMALSAPTLTARVLVVVRRLAAHGGVPVSDGLRLDVSQQDIALAAGASRQRVSLELRRLEEQGALRLQYRHLVVLDPRRRGGAPQLGSPSHGSPTDLARISHARRTTDRT